MASHALNEICFKEYEEPPLGTAPRKLLEENEGDKIP